MTEMTPSGGRSPRRSKRAAAHAQSEGAEEAQQRLRERERRRRRIDEVFGTVLPATTDDEREPGERGGFSSEYYRANRPPHHGGR